MSANYKTIDDMVKELAKCTYCCKGGYMSYHCQLCPSYKPKDIAKVKKHLTVHWKTGVMGPNGICSVFCHNTHGSVNVRHYHCSICKKIIIRNKRTMQRHVEICSKKENKTEEQEGRKSEDEDETEYITEDHDGSLQPPRLDDEEETEVFINLGARYRSCLRKNPEKKRKRSSFCYPDA